MGVDGRLEGMIKFVSKTRNKIYPYIICSSNGNLMTFHIILFNVQHHVKTPKQSFLYFFIFIDLNCVIVG